MQKKMLFPRWEKFVPLAQSVLNSRRPIVLHGLGGIGKKVFHQLRQREIPIVRIFDNDPALRGEEYRGVPVCFPQDYPDKSIPVVIGSQKFYHEIAHDLGRLGFHTVMPYLFLYFDQELDPDSYCAHLLDLRYLQYIDHQGAADDKRFPLRNIDVVITEKCSLRCLDCSNLMQYFTAPKNAEYEQVMHDLRHVFESAAFINEVHLLGGEPFVNPEVASYIEGMQEFGGHFSYLVVYSNGTITPSPDAISAMRRDNVILFLTEYGHPRQRIAEIAAKLRDSGVVCRVEVATEWQKCGELKRHKRSAAEMREVLRSCCVENFLTLKDGKLFRCPFAASAMALSATPESTHEYIDLADPSMRGTVLSGGIADLLSKDILLACEYCGGRHTHAEKILPAVQAKNPLPYENFG